MPTLDDPTQFGCSGQPSSFLGVWTHLKNTIRIDDDNKDLCLKSGVECMNVINPCIIIIFVSNTNPCTIIIYLHIYGLICDPHNDLLPVDLIAQLLEHCTVIAEVRVRIIVQV